jgi:hypothetical protein
MQAHFRNTHSDLTPDQRALYWPSADSRRAKKPKEAELPPVLRGFKPQQCSHPECLARPLFFRADHYLAHATSEHGVGADGMGVLIRADPPALDTLGDGSMVPQPCQICARHNRPAAFLNFATYFEHCRRVHALDDEADVRARLVNRTPASAAPPAKRRKVSG